MRLWPGPLEAAPTQWTPFLRAHGTRVSGPLAGPPIGVLESPEGGVMLLKQPKAPLQSLLQTLFSQRNLLFPRECQPPPRPRPPWISFHLE